MEDKEREKKYVYLFSIFKKLGEGFCVQTSVL
jgi:hypothetical protein